MARLTALSQLGMHAQQDVSCWHHLLNQSMMCHVLYGLLLLSVNRPAAIGCNETYIWAHSSASTSYQIVISLLLYSTVMTTESSLLLRLCVLLKPPAVQLSR